MFEWLLLSSLWCGFSIVFGIGYPLLGIYEAVFGSITLGFAISTWIGYVLGCFVEELNTGVILGTIFSLFTISLAFFKPVIEKLLLKRRILLNEIFDKKVLWLAVIVGGGAFLYLNHTHVLHLQDGFYHSGGSVWGDIAMDMNTINSFVHGVNRKMGFSTEPMSPIFAGHKLATSFFPSFHSALLIVSGLPTRLSILIPNVLLSLSLIGLLYLFLERFIGRIGLVPSTQTLWNQLFESENPSSSSSSSSSPSSSSSSSSSLERPRDGDRDDDDKHRKYQRQRLERLRRGRLSIGPSGAALAGLIVFFLSGGVGFFYWAARNRFNLNHDYVESYGTRAEYNLYWFATIPHVLLPQRNAIYAYPTAAFALICLYEGIKSSLGMLDRLKLFLLGGIATSLMPMFQGQSFLAILIIACGVVASKPSDLYRPKILASWFAFSFPVIVFGITQIAYFLVGARRAETLKIEFIPSDEWINSVFGMSIVATLVGPFVFWIRALGLFLPLAVMGTLSARQETQRRFAFGAWILFVFANLVRFQSWKYDNIKFFAIFMMIMVGIVGLFVVRTIRSYRSPVLFKMLALFAFITLIFSGSLALRREFSNYSVFHSPEDHQVGEWALGATNPDAVFVTTNKHNHPISTIAGRTLFAGFSGWLHGHGYDDWEDRVKIQDKILQGDSEAKELIRSNGIHYIVFEFKDQAVHPFLNDFPIVYDNQYVVFDVSRPR